MQGTAGPHVEVREEQVAPKRHKYARSEITNPQKVLSKETSTIRMLNDLEEILQLAEAVVAPLAGVTVVDARWAMQGARRSLEVTIHRPGSRISLDDCELVSRQLEKVLDEANPPVVEGTYILEIQSPGLERELKTAREFAVFLGETVEINTRQQHELLGWTFTGRLQARDDATITIAQPKPTFAPASSKSKKKAVDDQQPPESVVLTIEQVAKVKLHPEFK